MAGLGLIEDIYEETNRRIKNATQSVAKKSDNRVKEIRADIIHDWFGVFHGADFAAKNNNLVQKKFSFGNLSSHIEIDSWTESSMLPPHSSADRWLSTHGGGKPSNEYVADLIFDEGIIGLPERTTYWPNYTQCKKDGGYIWYHGENMYFYQINPLSEEIENSGLWDTYMNEVEAEILARLDD